MMSLKILSNLKIRKVLTVAFFALILTGLLALRAEKMGEGHPHFAQPWDHQHYIQMAKQNFGTYTFPHFSYRVLNPWLAKQLPFNLETNFFTLSFIFIWLTSLLMFYITERLYPDSETYAWLGLFLFFALGWASKFSFFNFWLTDPLVYFLISLSFYSILTRREWIFAACLALGILAKESILAVVPLYYTFHAQKKWDPQCLRRLVFLLMPSLLIFIALRLFISDPRENLSVYQNAIPHFISTRWKEISLSSFYQYTLGSFGLALVVALLGIQKNTKLFLRLLPFGALVYFQLWIASNTERLLALGFLGVVPLAVAGFQFLHQKTSWDLRFFLLFPILSFSAIVVRVSWFQAPAWLELVLWSTTFAIISFLKLRTKGHEQPL